MATPGLGRTMNYRMPSSTTRTSGTKRTGSPSLREAATAGVNTASRSSMTSSIFNNAKTGSRYIRPLGNNVATVRYGGFTPAHRGSTPATFGMFKSLNSSRAYGSAYANNQSYIKPASGHVHSHGTNSMSAADGAAIGMAVAQSAVSIGNAIAQIVKATKGADTATTLTHSSGTNYSSTMSSAKDTGSLGKAITSAKGGLKNIDKGISDANTKLETAQGETQSLKDTAADLALNVDVQRSVVNDMSQAVNEAKSELLAAQARGEDTTELEAKLSQAEANLKAARDELASLQEQKQEADQAVEANQNEIQSAEKEIKQLQDQKAELQQNIQKEEARYQKLVNEEKAQLAKAQSELSNLQDKRSKMSTDARKDDNLSKGENKKLADMDAKIAAADAKVKQLQALVNNHKASFDE